MEKNYFKISEAILQKNKNEFQFLKWIKKIQKLSAVRKVLETIVFLALESFGSKTVWETVLAWA